MKYNCGFSITVLVPVSAAAMDCCYLTKCDLVLTPEKWLLLRAAGYHCWSVTLAMNEMSLSVNG